MVDVATGKVRRVARGGSEPAWSPNGKRIAFVRTLETGRGDNEEIVVVGADGTGERRLTHNAGADFAPNWQPLR